MYLPQEIKKAINMLETAGFEAYAVGGCVRDSLLGKSPTDYDVTTSATPDEMKTVFANEHTIETGIKHGTLTVLMGEYPVEITTFRIDKEYLDNRHPSKVEFTRSLKEDLARRDFTVNALAYSEKTGIIDMFGGTEDLEHGIIRAVGDPDKRFTEDALRIIRALRFSSVLGFKIEENTSLSAERNRHLLKNISAERLFSEFKKLLCGKDAHRIILEHPDIISVFIPEIAVLKNFEQHHFRHHLDVLGHTALVIKNVPPVPVLRLAAFFHDIAKPLCFSLDENGTGHFYGHASFGAKIAEEVLTRLKADNKTKEEVSALVLHHEDRFEASPAPIKRLLSKIGPAAYDGLLTLMFADDCGKKPEYQNPEGFYNEYRKIADEIINKKECFSLCNLAVNGKDLISIGIEPGHKLGEILDTLLSLVIEEKIENDKEKLLEFAKKSLIL